MKPYSDLTMRGQVRRIRPIADSLLRFHGLRADRLEFINHGENTTWRASVGDDKYLVRVHRPNYQSAANIRSEMIFIEHLQSKGLKVPKPVFVDGEAVFSFDAPGLPARDAVLFRWIPGRFQSGFGPAMAGRLGAFMAQLHNASEDLVRRSGFERKVWDVDGLAHNIHAMEMLQPSDREVFEAVKETFEQTCQTIGQGGEKFGMVHADLHFNNRLMQNGELWAIDFDDCGDGWFLYDIAVAVAYHERFEGFMESLEKFVSGYRAHRTLDEADIRFLPAFIAARRMQVALWVVSRTDNPRFVEISPEVVAVTVGRLRRFLDA